MTTAIERTAERAEAFGVTATMRHTQRDLILEAANGDSITVSYDRLGRLTSAHRYEAGSSTCAGVLPAAGLEDRVRAWIIAHEVDTRPSASRLAPGTVTGDAIFDALEQAYVEIDGFGTRDEYVSTFCRHCGIDRPNGCPHTRTVNVVSGTATVGQMIGHVGVSLGRTEERVRAARERGRQYAADAEHAGISLDPVGRDGALELGLLDREEQIITHAATLSRSQAEALYRLLGAQLGR